MMRYGLRSNHRTVFWFSFTCISAYIVHKCLKKLKVKPIDEKKNEDKHVRRMLLLGLKGAGKTSLMDQIYNANGDYLKYTVPPQPTCDILDYGLYINSYLFYVFELGGVDSLSLDYSHLLYEKSLVVFVIDSSDLYKMPFVALSLKKLLDCPQIKEIPVLIVANKQDDPNALKPEEMKKVLHLSNISRWADTDLLKMEVIGCQTRPLPDLPEGESMYTWCHSSIKTLENKIYSMIIQGW